LIIGPDFALSSRVRLICGAFGSELLLRHLGLCGGSIVLHGIRDGALVEREQQKDGGTDRQTDVEASRELGEGQPPAFD